VGFGAHLSTSNEAVIRLGRSVSTTALTFRDLRAGLPQRFLEEHRERQQILESSIEPFVEARAFTVTPLTLAPFLPYHLESGYAAQELTHSFTHWANRSVAAYYGVGGVIGLSPEHTVASARPVHVRHNDMGSDIVTYIISDMHFFRPRDLAYILQDVFDVNFYDGQYVLDTSKEFIPVGGEATLPMPENRLQTAYLFSDTLIIDGLTRNIPSYVIRGEVYYRNDLLSWLDVELINRGGVFHLYYVGRK
jgi:hypothetical protein